MKNARNITPIEAVTLAEKLIELLVKGFENVGYRKKTNSRVETLEELSIAQNKRITELEEKIKNL